ncbi:unnamed protein product [Owenia fusiformis]|uniref:SREBP regulating gene protein n=1 Tax=Owenia fusiformis TaxID=6347 RepID=A0A8S4Q5F3_OWEFU|nr:unnamed protein product [Owenia fusiformis]
MLNSRILRKRWVLAVIFLFSLAYFLINIYRQSEKLVSQEDYIDRKRLLVQPDAINWEAVHFTQSNSSKSCRNSVQGKQLIADERGYVCNREEVDSEGCCRTTIPSTKRYTCDSCTNTGCCSIYEHCISCCLQPDKQPLLRKILSKTADTFHNLFASVTDHFELCLAKCRTSSQSVQHENSYRDPKAKYCYGDKPPDLQPVAIQ